MKSALFGLGFCKIKYSVLGHNRKDIILFQKYHLMKEVYDKKRLFESLKDIMDTYIMIS